MSSNALTSSDDDRPLDKRYQTGLNGHVVTNGNGNVDDDSSDSAMSEDDDLPLSQTARPNAGGRQLAGSSKRKRPHNVESSSSDDDTPLASSPAKQSKSAAISMPGAVEATVLPPPPSKMGFDGSETSKIKVKRMAQKSAVPPKKKVKKEETGHKEGGDDGSSSEDDAPIIKKAAKRKAKVKVESEAEPSSEEEKLSVKKARKRASTKKVKEEEGSVSEAPKVKKKVKGEPQGSAKKVKGSKKEELDEGEEVYRWWEAQQANGDGEEKWQTLEHSGVIFPPPYEPLPSHVKMKYNGKPVDLDPIAEEVAGFYAAMLETEHAQDNTFNKNFFEDWKKVLKDAPPRNKIKITNFEHCDFRPMYEYFEGEKAKKKAMTTAEKKELKKQKDAYEEKYVTCVLDGRKEKVGNFRVEPPGLFRGRGDHPKKGALKFRVRPEDITINIGAESHIPIPNMPGTWKQIIHDKTVTWLANWVENINGNHKYVFLAAGSSLKGQSDMSKFEKARELKKHVDRIRQDYNADLRSKIMADRQRATAMYFIDRLALRAGNEKGEDEADTVGCCSLRCEHVTLEAPNFIIFDFLGKDSIRYYNRVAVEFQVFKNIRYFKENKEDNDNLFDRVNTTLLNKHLQSYMKGLTAKVFRTYNASITFQEQLDESTPENATVQEKLNAYNHANRMVAILCNHQRSAPKTHEQSMEKMRDRKKKPYANDESDLDDDWIEQHEESLKNKDIEKAQKKFAKDNEKLVEEGKAPLDESALQDKIDSIEADYEKLVSERGTERATLKRERPIEKLEENIQKLDEKMKTFKLQMDDREAGKEVALGTSKINYLDPRITAAWCKTHDVPIEKIFSKTLLVKCTSAELYFVLSLLMNVDSVPWAMEVDNNWKF
ncbi:hypothetical protein SERLA73DRAFT_106466 [Serpula lacrymans var. lacrymans S7.3]|uniref:DNA topoisomerase I n=1 Tax=Serpula lacrymans var. lacrymans (strain S7.3) TaxID=936435 RepID=F8PUW8_SERL3|nr:hypothetical protein SERLA73DRAFT_106466 [Serpula lacrymans var. lacrymans S7.3]